jgi:two-component system chemotaxis sensor kinase CheA
VADAAREQRLLRVFLEELEEHRQSLGHDLLALEASGDFAQQRALVENMFRAVHSLKGAAHSVQAAAIEQICHRLEQNLQSLRHTGGAPSSVQLSAWFALLDTLDSEAERLAPTPSVPPPRPADGSTPELAPQRDTAQDRRLLRIASEKVDLLLNRSADLVNQATLLDQRMTDFEELRDLLRQLSGSPSEADRAPLLGRLARSLEQAEEGFRRGIGALLKGSERLDDEAQRLRMVPFGQSTEGLERAARDLALSLDKPVELRISGQDIEIDRVIAQRLRDPLLHLLRNALSHGIETRGERAMAGKPATARVELKLSLLGKSVQVVLSDDGRGFDAARIREQARSQALPHEVGERELFSYAFLPGFSTATSVTELAGRGVGLDAVKRAVEGMHGTIELESVAGRGARFVMRLPLTLSKLRCFFVAAAGRWYAIPASSVLRVLPFVATQVITLEGRTLVRTPDGLLPLASLTHLLDVSASGRPSEPRAVLVLMGDERTWALAVDELGAEREITARALPARVAGLRQVSSVTFVTPGRMALVLSPPELYRRTREAPQPAGGLVAPAAKRRPRILIAEDSATTRAVLKSVLEEAHYEVTTTQDGEEAFGLLQKGDYDLVLSDVQMPHKDGFSLAEDIRADARLARLPVVLMTSLESEADRMRGLQAGASAYLTKRTFDHPLLLSTIASLL